MKITAIRGTWVHVPIPEAGQHVSNFGRVASFDSVIVRIDTDAGVQAVYPDDDRLPLFQSAWTPKGPVVTRARQRVAFLGDLDTLIEPEIGFDPLDRVRNPLQPNPLANPYPNPLSLAGDGGLGLAGLALFALYAAQQTAPASQGLAESDKPAIVFKAWTVDTAKGATPILVDALTEEQLRQDCKYLPDVQRWANEAAMSLSAQRAILPARTWGSFGAWPHKGDG